jgi:hypothetical protein
MHFEPLGAGTAVALRPNMSSRLRFVAAIAAFAMLGCATGGAREDEDETAAYVGTGEAIDVDDAKADEAGEIRVRADGLTVWIRPAIETREAEGQIRFVLRGRASRNLESAFSFVPDDPFGTATLVGRRAFEVELLPHEASTLFFGLPLLVSLHAPGAPHDGYVVQIRGRVRLTQFAGSRSIRIDSSIKPILVGGPTIVYRARATTSSGYESLSVQISDGTGVDVVREHERAFRFDLTYDRLASAIHGALTPTTFTAYGSAGTVRKTARFSAAISRVAVTYLDPYEVWPAAECDAEVLECLRSLGADTDTEVCGDAFAVTRCSWRLDAERARAERFATDLRAHLASWYAIHGADVIAADGNDLASAQAAVSSALVTEITRAEDDPLGHDLTTVRVLSHPDVAFPGSDRVWIGAYDRGTDALVDLSDFE